MVDQTNAKNTILDNKCWTKIDFTIVRDLQIAEL